MTDDRTSDGQPATIRRLVIEGLENRSHHITYEVGAKYPMPPARRGSPPLSIPSSPPSLAARAGTKFAARIRALVPTAFG